MGGRGESGYIRLLTRKVGSPMPQYDNSRAVQYYNDELASYLVSHNRISQTTDDRPRLTERLCQYKALKVAQALQPLSSHVIVNHNEEMPS